jgi:pantoate--beta-alanine ligase
MEVVRTIAEARAARGRYARLGLVPTMGYLHEGHLSLVRRAKDDCGSAAVSIFVNPAQFAPGEDLAKYPRDLPRDLERLSSVGTDLVFTPDAAQMYAPGFDTRIDVGRYGRVLEGASRPGHFAAVATIVAKLFNILTPTRAYFGQKDAQQTVVIRRLARDLDIAAEIVVAPTVRAADGLALSSRNIYLDPSGRAAAPVLYRSLEAAAARFAAGERAAERLREAVRATIASEPRVALEYVHVVDPEELVELEVVGGAALVLIAARVGATRLIDNVLLRSA